MRLRISWALAIIATAAGLTMTCLQASAPLGTPSSQPAAQPAAQPARSGNLGGPAQVLGRAAHDHHVLGVFRVHQDARVAADLVPREAWPLNEPAVSQLVHRP
jgi:hypothetical protein